LGLETGFDLANLPAVDSVVVQTLQYLAESPMISIQPPKPGYPAERAIHDPAPRQQNESALRLTQTYDLKGDALTSRVGVGLVAGKTLGDVRQFDRLAGHLPYLLG
jgi:hypothetical protein